MAFYFDPGYGQLIEPDGKLTTIQNDTYNPTSGVAFTSEDCFYSFKVPLTGISSKPEGYRRYSMRLKLSVYCENMSAYSTQSNCFSVGFAKNQTDTYPNWHRIEIAKNHCAFFSNDLNFGVAGNPNHFHYFDGHGNLSDGLHNISLTLDFRYHLDDNLSERQSLYAVDVDGDTAFYTGGSNMSGQVTYPQKFGIRFPSAAYGTFYVSNVLIEHAILDSTTENAVLIPAMSQIVKLPLKNTSGDFISVGDGEYVGNTSGQKLLSTIDASSVVEKFGASSKVSHLVTYGAPGYRVGSNVTTAYGISESDSTITSHGSTELSTDTDATACVAWEADSGTTLPDIDGLKIGWQV